MSQYVSDDKKLCIQILFSQNEDFRGQFYEVTELALLEAENLHLLTNFGTENHTKMAILRADFFCSI